MLACARVRACVFTFDLLLCTCRYTFDRYSSEATECCKGRRKPAANVKLVWPIMY